MTSKETFTQCKLSRGEKVDVSWIPTKFAVVGNYLEILGENGWLVTSVGKVKPAKSVRDFEREYLKTRERTDEYLERVDRWKNQAGSGPPGR